MNGAPSRTARQWSARLARSVTTRALMSGCTSQEARQTARHTAGSSRGLASLERHRRSCAPTKSCVGSMTTMVPSMVASGASMSGLRSESRSRYRPTSAVIVGNTLKLNTREMVCTQRTPRIRPEDTSTGFGASTSATGVAAAGAAVTGAEGAAAARPEALRRFDIAREGASAERFKVAFVAVTACAIVLRIARVLPSSRCRSPRAHALRGPRRHLELRCGICSR